MHRVLLTFLMTISLPVLRADGSELYVRRDTWAATLLASRTRYAEWWNAQLGGVRLGPWHTTSRKDPLDSSQTVDLAARDRKGKPLWDRRLDLVDGVVHYDLSNHGISTQRRLPAQGPDDAPTAARNPKGPASLCQVRTLHAAKPTTVTAWLGAQNGLEVWLNGACVFANIRLGDGLQPTPDQAKATLPLAAGDNQLVLRLLDAQWSGFCFSLASRDRIEPSPFHALLGRLARDFPVATRRMQADSSEELLTAWFRDPTGADLLSRLVDRAAVGLGSDAKALQAKLRAAADEGRRLSLYTEAAHLRKARADLDGVDIEALRLAVRDLAATFPDAYAGAAELLRRADAFEKRLPEIGAALSAGEPAAVRAVGELIAFQREALLANPLLNFDRLLLVRRKTLGDPRRAKAPNRGMGEFLGLPQQSAWQLDRIRQPYGWDNDIAVLDMGAARARRQAPLATLYRPPTPRLVCDIDLHFGGGRLLFSMPGSSALWQVFEMDADGRRARQLSPVEPRDVQSFDACYLPDDSIAFASTALFQGVPCSDGIAVAVIYRMQADGAGIRQLCFDQDHDYCPTVTNDGRILYMRWDYTDLPHQWPRILFTMNPDGTGQREFYGSNSYWPNAIFYARPVPDHPTRVVGIVTGHHVGRVGELVVFDPALGRHEADGVVQRIPGRGKTVEPIIKDKLAIDSWPKFVHPHPLSSKYFLVSCKPGPDSLWGVYLVDVFDNMVLLREEEGRGLFEPIPFRATPRPPVITDRVDLARQDALMYVEDVYQGPGLRGVPRGTVKTLRLFTYAFAYPYKSGGQHRVGSDGPWEPKRVLGTVPVESDGSALFRVPANTPISMQPLDGRGRAVQLMRSWTTAMPGEIVSCTGCHESQSTAPSGRKTLATLRPPSEIQPWHGPARGFSFPREVQPVLDAHCVRCHDGKTKPDLRAEQGFYVVFDNRDPRPKRVSGVAREELVRCYAGVFPPAYVALRRHVRVGGLESDLHLLNPREFGANTAELVQMLEKGHYGVRLDAEAWERLAAWIDLNAPCHGTWREVLGGERIRHDDGRRRALRTLYGGTDDDVETIVVSSYKPLGSETPLFAPRQEPARPHAPGWPFGAAEAVRRQKAAGASTRTLDLGGGVQMGLALIPAGQFVMGDPQGLPDEAPLTRVEIDNPFWIGACEVTNEQYARFDPLHDSRHEHGTASFNSERALGPKLNAPTQPVVRVSWLQAMAFCRWLSERTGQRVTLPTEAQWEYACRAGTSSPFFYGGLDTDFARHANMADATIGKWATYNERRRSADQTPRDARFDDGSLVTAPVGRTRPNPWGLHDMHGNVWEWTRSAYAPYPYRDDGRNDTARRSRRAVRGGSWYDRPSRCRSAFRLSYPTWQRVYNVGFRIVVREE